MLNITKKQEGTALTIALEGRLDTNTAPEFQAEAEPLLGGIDELMLDCEALDYISSAGLRVLLTFEQEFERDNKGNSDHWLYKNENDCLRTSAGMWLHSFFNNPLPLKLAVLYGIYRIGYATDGFDGMRQEIEQMPQSVRDLVDKMIEESKQKED
jgi:anti-sigma B factor antagonist